MLKSPFLEEDKYPLNADLKRIARQAEVQKQKERKIIARKVQALFNGTISFYSEGQD